MPTPLSSWVDLQGPTHVVDHGGSGSLTFLLVHGLGGSHLDWMELAPLLAPMGHVLAIDLPAFGLSPSAGRRSSVDADVALIRSYLDQHVSGHVVLVGNSRGGMVCALVAAAETDRVRGVVLVDPALPRGGALPDPRAVVELLPAALPALGPCVVRRGRARGAEAAVRRFLFWCFADQDRVPAAYRQALTEQMERRTQDLGEDLEVARAARTLLARLRSSAYAAELDSIQQPVLLVHGTRDRLVPVASARRALALRPHWTGVVLDGIGHTPQLEAPGAVASALSTWLDEVAA